MPLTRRTFPVVMFLVVAALGTTRTAVAGTVSFDIHTDNTTLTLTEHGDETAFAPRVYALEWDGSWRELPRVSATNQTANGESAQYDGRLLNQPSAHPARAVQIRFLDKAGVGFGQLATLGNWPAAPVLRPSWNEGWLVLAPERPVATSWVLTAPLQLTPPPRDEGLPSAVRVDWPVNGAASHGETRIKLDLTQDCPVLLLNQTGSHDATSYTVQRATPTENPAFPQRPIWLRPGQWWFAVAALALGAAWLGAAHRLPWRRGQK